MAIPPSRAANTALPHSSHWAAINTIGLRLTALKKAPITEKSQAEAMRMQESLNTFRREGMPLPFVDKLAKELDDYLATAFNTLRDVEEASFLSRHPLADILRSIQSEIESLEKRHWTEETLEQIVASITALQACLADLKNNTEATALVPEIERLEQRLERYCSRVLEPSSAPGVAPIARRASTLPPVRETIHTLCPGLNNDGANCWLNSLMQMITNVPSIETAYRTFAGWKRDQGTDTEKHWGQVLLEQLERLKEDQQEHRAISRADTQKIRLAFHHLFRNVLNEPIFSDSPGRHEDLQEGLMKIMEGYADALAAQRQPLPACYSNVNTVRHYRPTGTIYDADPAKLAKNEYSVLQPDNTAALTSAEFHISLPLQDVPERNVDALLLRYFRQNARGDEPAKYLGADGRLHQHMLTETRIQFTQPPEELVICVGRFAAIRDIHNPAAEPRREKITDAVPFKKFLTLPREASATGEEVTMELDAFAVHGGGLGGGHYISYKKIDGVWMECNDSLTRIVPEQEIDAILQTSYVHHYRRTATASAPAYRVPIARPAVVAPLPTVIKVPTYQQLVLEARAHAGIRKDTIKSLEQVYRTLLEGKEIDLVSIIPKSVRIKLYGPAWLRDSIGTGIPSTDPEYGRHICDENPATLNRPCPPLFSTEGTLLEQLLSWQRDLLQTDQALALVLQIRAVREAMLSSCSNEEILRLYEDLPLDVRKSLEMRVYSHHVIIRGKEVCNDPQYGGDYGRVTLDTNIRVLYDVKDMVSTIGSSEQLGLLLLLLEATHTPDAELKRVFSDLTVNEQNAIYGFVYHAHVDKFGAQRCRSTEKGSYGKITIAANPRVLLEKPEGSQETMIEHAHCRARLEALEKEYLNYQHRLEAYRALLQNPALTQGQLINAFEYLEVPSQLKNSLYLMIAEANSSSSVQKGMQLFLADPRCIEKIFEKTRYFLQFWKEQKSS